ncbi:hypothetical protein HYH03_007072 [Edaphochlamys debaryana]|uniref:Protease Do-like PDZ domain-containing protein n=1 Tax=Edaphochlamys debaryana TaxID=47281 RepID=A0A836BZI8_9CHLO|nr:hypothetical protein HYH03_007072 [Edaphochlamys debaryana]|eukprot:KAG2494831.1 hypothetical protein HYH03_007072 [Edaphochlamys debaryana]
MRQPSRRPPLRLQTRPPGDEERPDAGEEAGAGAEVDARLPGVVRLQCVQDVPRFDMPLLLGSFRSSTCNAVAVSYGGQSYLLAPAAAVIYGGQVRVSLPGRDKPFPAKVAHLGLECELAALQVESPEFWEALVPYELALDGLPHLQQPCSVVSYAEAQPRPRSLLGTVVRTEIVTYPSAMQRLLGMTVGVGLSRDQLGSAVVDAQGLCLGIVFGRTLGGKASGARKQGGRTGAGAGGDGSGERWGMGRRRVGRRRGRRGGVEASAAVVPVPVVTHFLEDISKHGRYLGFPTLGITWRRTESHALRAYAGMRPGQTGILIASINPTAPLAAVAQPLDVLAAVGGAAVDNDGTVEFRGGREKINIAYHISQFQVGDSVELTLLRQGEPRTVRLELGVPGRLLPVHLGGRPPSYLVLSGLVLTGLSGPFLEGAFGRAWPVRSPVQLLREWQNNPSAADEQVVVVAECQDLGPTSATDGYERRAVMHQRVVRCNGAPVRSLAHLAALVGEAQARADALGSGSGSGSGGGRQGGKGRKAAPAPAADAATTTIPASAAGGASDGADGNGDGNVNGSGAAGAAEAAGANGQPSIGNGPPLDERQLLLELSNRMLLVLPLQQAGEDTKAMLAEYEVEHPVSADLRPAYEAALQGGQAGAGAAGALAAGGKGAKGSRGGAKGRTG